MDGKKDNYRRVECCLICGHSKEPLDDLCECLEGFKVDNRLVYKYFVCDKFKRE